jgi:hypothetical protein
VGHTCLLVDLKTFVLGFVQVVRHHLQLSAYPSMCRLVLLATVASTHSPAVTYSTHGSSSCVAEVSELQPLRKLGLQALAASAAAAAIYMVLVCVGVAYCKACFA